MVPTRHVDVTSTPRDLVAQLTLDTSHCWLFEVQAGNPPVRAVLAATQPTGPALSRFHTLSGARRWPLPEGAKLWVWCRTGATSRMSVSW